MLMKRSAGLHTSGTTGEPNNEPRIESPIPEFDKYSDDTRYTDCGIETMRRRDLRNGGCECDGGWS